MAIRRNGSKAALESNVTRLGKHDASMREALTRTIVSG